MNAYKKYTLLTLALPPAFFLFYILFMFLADPLQLFHKSYFKENSLEENMRQQAAGIINNYDFDALILGNSYMENTSSAICSKLFDANFVNLSLGGSSNYERALVIDYALKNKKIKTVINVIDINTHRTGSQSYPFELWGMLYDDIRYNDFRVYFDMHFLKSVFTPSRNVEFGRPNAWFKDPWYTSRLGGIDNWLRHSTNRQVSDLLYKKLPSAVKNGPQQPKMVSAKRKREIKEFIAQIMGEQAQRHPDTRFIYIFPPFTRLYYALNTYSGSIEEYYYWHEAMLEASDLWSNIEIYAFAHKEYVDDIKHYIDTNHYDEWINTSMMEDIAQGKSKLTRENITAYLELSRKKAQAFDLETFAEYVKNNLP